MPMIQHQPSMAAGEIGPHLYGRVDQELYYIAMRTVRNFLIQKYGGASNRPGKKFTAEARYPDKKAVLIDFDFNDQQTYAIEFGDLYMRFVKEDGQVLEAAQNITGITQADPAVVTITAHPYSNGDDVYLSGIEGMTELNSRTVRIANATANTFEITDFRGTDIDTTGYTAYSTGGTAARVYTVTTPYLEADLYDLNWAQDNDVLTVVHQSYYPRDITRTGHTAWTINEFANTQGPFKDINGSATTVYSDAASGSVTLTASAGIFTNAMVGDLFYLEQSADDTTERWEAAKSISTNDVRRAGFHYYEAQNSATTGTYRPDHIEGTATDGDGGVEWEYLHSGFGIVEITAYTSATSVDGTVVNRLPDNVVGSGGASTNWAFAAWSSTEGYPAACAYHKERFMFGGTSEQPNSLWMSGTALRSYFGQSQPILADDAIRTRLNATGANPIRHLVPLTELIILTSAAEHMINGRDDIIAADDPLINNLQGKTGSSNLMPITINNLTIFVDDYGATVRSLQYQLDSDTFGGIDLTARSPHLFEDKTIVDWAYARHPYSVVWTIMSDGELNGFTIMDEQKVYAWHRHDTDGTYESVCTLREGNETASYFVINRTIDGNTRRYIERLSTRSFSTMRDAFFVDSGLSYDGRNTGSTTMTITGGTDWDETETLTITASASTFKSTDVGDEVAFFHNDERYSLEITAYTSGTVVSGVPDRTLPAEYQATAFTNWELARTTFRPLDHIEGKSVAILADGAVVEGKSVSDGVVMLDSPAAVVHIGLAYTCDLETLDIARPLKQTSKYQTANVPRVFIEVQDSRSFDVHIDGFTNKGYPVRDRIVTEAYKIPQTWTDYIEQGTASSWSKKGRVGIRQTNPLPVTVNLIAPEVEYGVP